MSILNLSSSITTPVEFNSWEQQGHDSKRFTTNLCNFELSNCKIWPMIFRHCADMYITKRHVLSSIRPILHTFHLLNSKMIINQIHMYIQHVWFDKLAKSLTWTFPRDAMVKRLVQFVRKTKNKHSYYFLIWMVETIVVSSLPSNVAFPTHKLCISAPTLPCWLQRAW